MIIILFFESKQLKGTETSVELRKLIVSHYQNRKSLQEISNIVNRSRSTVQYIIKQYKIENILENKVRNLNRKLLSDRDEQKVLREMKKNPKISAPKIASKLENEAVRRGMRRYGYNGRVARKNSYISEANRKKRLQVAKKHVKWTYED